MSKGAVCGNDSHTDKTKCSAALYTSGIGTAAAHSSGVWLVLHGVHHLASPTLQTRYSRCLRGWSELWSSSSSTALLRHSYFFSTCICAARAACTRSDTCAAAQLRQGCVHIVRRVAVGQSHSG
jgi:hypothetical protein